MYSQTVSDLYNQMVNLYTLKWNCSFGFRYTLSIVYTATQGQLILQNLDYVVENIEH